MDSKRVRRVANLIQKGISEVIQRDIRDPRMRRLTITRVKLTADLKSARIFYSVMGDQTQRDQTQLAIERSSSYIRGRLAEKMVIRYLPKLTFMPDETLDYVDRIEHLLAQIKENGDGLTPP